MIFSTFINAYYCYIFTGAVAPLGYFDPLSLSKGKTEGECRKIRESELKHGRVAMVS